MKQTRVLIGVNVFWFALSFLSHGLNSLLLPFVLIDHTSPAIQASILGLLTFAGIGASAWARPLMDEYSQRVRAHGGRRMFLLVGVCLMLAGMTLLAAHGSLAIVLGGYIFIQFASGAARAAQRGFVLDMIPLKRRASVANLKTLMNLGGTVLSFLIIGQLLRIGEPFPAIGAMATFLVMGLILTLVLVREPRHPLPDSSALVFPKPTEAEQQAGVDALRQRAVWWLDSARFLFFTGMFGVGRFLFYFLHARVGLDTVEAAAETGFLLTVLAAITVLVVILAGVWVGHVSRFSLMLTAMMISAAGALLLIRAHSSIDFLVYGSLMAIGLGAFLASNWEIDEEFCLQAESHRVNRPGWLGAAGAAAAAGLLGLVIDGSNYFNPGTGYTALFIAAAAFFILSGAALWQVRHQVQQAATTSITVEP